MNGGIECSLDNRGQCRWFSWLSCRLQGHRYSVRIPPTPLTIPSDSKTAQGGRHSSQINTNSFYQLIFIDDERKRNGHYHPVPVAPCTTDKALLQCNYSQRWIAQGPNWKIDENILHNSIHRPSLDQIGSFNHQSYYWLTRSFLF
jgi:hypothetical protein